MPLVALRSTAMAKSCGRRKPDYDAIVISRQLARDLDATQSLRVVGGTGSIEARNVQLLCRRLCSSSLIVFEQSTKPGTAQQRLLSMRRRRKRHDQHVAEALLIALVMKMGPVFPERMPQHPLPDRDQPRLGERGGRRSSGRRFQSRLPLAHGECHESAMEASRFDATARISCWRRPQTMRIIKNGRK